MQVAFEPRALSVQLLRLLLNFMDHKPHGNKESERPCYYKSVKTGAIFHGLNSMHSWPLPQVWSAFCTVLASDSLLPLSEAHHLVLRFSGYDIPL